MAEYIMGKIEFNPNNNPIEYKDGQIVTIEILQKNLDIAVEALRIIVQSKLHVTDRLDAALLFCELLQTQARAALASIKK